MGDLHEGDLTVGGLQGAAEPLGRLTNPSVGRRPPQKRIQSATRGVAAVVKVEIRQVEREAQVVAKGVVVEDPLGNGPHAGKAGMSIGQDVSFVDAGLPVDQAPACVGDLRAQCPAEVAGEGAQPWLHPEPAEQRAELVVRIAEQIATNVVQEV